MKILGIVYGEVSSYSLIEDGKVVDSKVLSSKDPLRDFKENHEVGDVKYFVTTFPESSLTKDNKFDYEQMRNIAGKNKGQIYCLGNNQALAAYSYFSNDSTKSLIVTIMDEGEEQGGFKSSFTVWLGEKNSIVPFHTFESQKMNILRIWSNIAQTVFNLQPSVESFIKISDLAKQGDGDRYFELMWNMITQDHETMSMNLNKRNIRKYFNLFSENKIASEDKKDIAAALQRCTVESFTTLIDASKSLEDFNHVSLSGLIGYNKDLVSEIQKSFPEITVHTSDCHDADEISRGAAMFIHNIVLELGKKDEDS